MPTIVLRDVHMAYRRRAAPAVRGLTLTMGPGVTGVGGPNGAGKTTLLKLVLGCIRPTSGTCEIDGEPPDAYRSRVGVGFVPENPAFDEHLTVREFLTGIHRLGGESSVDAEVGVATRARDVYGAGALDAISDRRLGRLSLGQRRRVALAAASVGSPDLLLLDEPTNGLDPVAVAWLRDEIHGYRAAGRSIIIASHHLDELERIVDRIVILHAGRIGAVWDRVAALERFGSFDALFHATIGLLDAAATPVTEAEP